MSEGKELASYLVGLKFKIDEQGLQKFNQSLQQLEKTMLRTVGDSNSGLVGDFLKMQTGLTGALAAIGAAFTSSASSLGDWSKIMMTGSMQAFMTTRAYTELNDAMKTTGYTLAQMTWLPEAHEKGLQAMQDSARLQDMLTEAGGEKAAKSIRDIQFEFSRLGLELTYLQRLLTVDIWKKLFPDDTAVHSFQRFNEWLTENLPKIADELSTDVVPLLKDLWETTKDVGEVFKDAFAIVQELTGALSGDSSLETTDVTLKSIAGTTEHVVHWVDDLVKSFLHLEEAILHLNPALLSLKDLEMLGAAGLATSTGRGLVLGVGKKILGAGAGAGAAEGIGLGSAATIGLPIAAGVGAGYELYQHRDSVESWNRNFLSGMPSIQDLFSKPIVSGDVHDRLRAAADAIAKLTGQKPDLIYGQLAHETGNGTNRGFTQLHNLSGIEDGHGHYRSFDSDESYDKEMSRILNRDFKGRVADNSTDYAAILKKGGYYEASQAEYAAGVARFQGQYGGAPTTITNQVTIHTTSPQSADQIAQIAVTKIQEMSDRNSLNTRYVAGGSGQ